AMQVAGGEERDDGGDARAVRDGAGAGEEGDDTDGGDVGRGDEPPARLETEEAEVRVEERGVAREPSRRREIRVGEEAARGDDADARASHRDHFEGHAPHDGLLV